MQLRAPLIVLESLPEGVVSIRAPLLVVEPLADSNRAIRQSLLVVEPLEDSFRTLRCPLLCIESLHPVAPEGHVSTELFPGSLGSPQALPGLAFTVHKRPTFSTAVQKAQSGVSTRNAQMQFPIFEFELSYEFLRDDVTQEYRTLRRFFKQRKGGFDTFLLKDPDDYLASNETLGTADGVTTQFPFLYDDQTEKIGQIDLGNTITIYGSIAESDSIPGTAPYQITVANAATFVADLGVTKSGVAMVKVAGSPAAGQYSVAAGVYSFNSADHGAAVVISYRYSISPSAYTVTLPNLLVFASAPASGLVISADFQFFYNCRFQDDAADFEKFDDGFWQLQKIVLETVPQ